MKTILLSALMLTSVVPAVDSTGAGEGQSNSAIFLNASSDSRPREISLGLPTNATFSVQIYEDGLPVSYYIYHLYPFKSWHGGVSAERTGSMGPMDAAMRYGEVNNFVDSYNRTGSDTFRGSLAYTSGSFGQQKFDLNMSGSFGRGWGWSASTYQNFDPGSNHNITPMLRDRHQFYKGVISKTFGGGNGRMALCYQYVDYFSLTENFGPFVFMKDGSVRDYEGFNLGRDSFRPSDATFTYMDMKDGIEKTLPFVGNNNDNTHHLTYTLAYDAPGGMHFDFRSRFKTGVSSRGAGSLSGITSVGAGDGYTFADGTPFAGNLQRRTVIHFDAFDTSWQNNAELSFRSGSHNLKFGADYAFNHGGCTTSSVNFSHEVKANPQMLYLGGKAYYNYNTAGEYYDGFENKAALYARDEWTFGAGRWLTAFLRAEYLGMRGKAANNIGDDTSNTRYPGFNLTKGKITDFSRDYFNGAAGVDFGYRIAGGLSVKAQAVFTRSHGNIYNFGGYYDPSSTPTDTRFAQGGVSYTNNWLNLVSQLVYISQTNNNSRSVFQHALLKEVGGYPVGFVESVTLPVTYGIESLGWTTDAIINPGGGFNLHLEFTIRNPRYRDFVFRPTFSDGVTEEYDFSGNNVTNLHKTELSVEPSYSRGDWRFWLSARYISKQYINKTNSLFFKERIETFGGIDYKLNQKCRLSLNVINLLNQKGASGLISSADLVTDASAYDNFVMSGTFIRPFTVELGVKLDF